MPSSRAFMADYNTRFAKAPANSKDLHRRLGPGDDLEDAFAWKEERTLSRALTLQYDKILFILEPVERAKPAPGKEQEAAIGKRVTVVDYPDGRLSILYKGIELAYRTFDKIQQVDQGAIVEEQNGSAPRSPSSARSSFAVNRSGAARKHRAGAISAMLVFSRSAEPFYEPSVLTPARSNNRCGFERSASGAARTLRYAGGSAPARRPTPVALTLLNWGKH